MSHLLITAKVKATMGTEAQLVSALALLQEAKAKQIDSILQAQSEVVVKDKANLEMYNKAVLLAGKLYRKVLVVLSDMDIKRTNKLQKEYESLSNTIKELEA